MRRRIPLLGMPLLAATLAVAGVLPAIAQEYEGFAEPYRTIDVATIERGEVAAVMVRDGDRVAAGQVLARLDETALRARRAVAEARANADGKLASAEAVLDLRRARLRSLEPLVRSGDAHREELERARGEVAVAAANLLTAQEERRVAQLDVAGIDADLRRRDLRSPVDGVVVSVNIEPGEVADGSARPLLTIVQLDPLIVPFHLATDVAMALAVGDPVTVGFLVFDRRGEGTIDSIAPVTDPDSGTVRVTVALPNPGLEFRAGERALLSFRGRAVPLAARSPTAPTDMELVR